MLFILALHIKNDIVFSEGKVLKSIFSDRSSLEN